MVDVGRPCGRHLLVLLMMLCPALPASAPEDTLFFDDFSSPDLSRNWFVHGEPSPCIIDSLGFPPPCFCNNGDSNVGSGAVSRELFEMDPGFFVECDFYMTCLERGTWVTVRLEIVTRDFRNQDATSEEYCMARMDLSYSGELDWSAPHRQAVLSFNCLHDLDSKFSVQHLHQNQLMDGWHRFRMEINGDRTVSYMVDDSLWCTSPIPIPDTVRTVRISLGDRSSSWGMALHDNVTVGRISPER